MDSDLLASITSSNNLGPPRLSAHLISRDGLLRRLDRLAPVTIVEALSGHGKTALVAKWAQQRQDQGEHVVWLRASAEHNTLHASLACLHAGLLHADLIGPVVAGEILDSSRLWERVSTALAALQGVRTIVVIDDMHHLNDPAIVDTLCSLIGQNAHLHLVVCVQVPHPLLEAAGRSHLEVNTVTGDDLTISAAEVSQFAGAWGYQLDEQKAGQLHELVGGWLVPMRLVLDANPATSETFATHVASDFLEQEVMPQVLDEHAARVAMRLAVCTTITETTVRVVLANISGNPAADALILADLQRVGVLQRIPQHGPAEWRFPTLVRRTLVDIFERRQPEEAGKCHRALARSLDESGGSLGEVLQHARSGGDWELLARLWTEHDLQLTVDFPEDAIFAYVGIAETVLVSNPALMVPAAVVHTLAAHPDEDKSGVLLRRFMQLGKHPLGDSSNFTNISEFGGAVVAAMIAQRGEGDFLGARKLAVDFGAEFEKRMQSGAAEARAGAWFYLQWGMTELLAGDLPRALRLSARAFDAAEGGTKDFLASNAAANIALIHALTGATSDAQRWLHIQGRFTTSDQWMHHLVALPARVAGAILAMDRLDAPAAEAELQVAGDGASGVELWPFIAAAGTRYALLFGNTVGELAHLEHLASVHARQLHQDGAARRILDRCRADILLSLGEAHRAQRLIGESSDSSPWLMATAARLHLITGNWETARYTAAASAWDKATNVRDRVDLLMIQAAAALALGNEEEALTAFGHGNSLAQHAGISGASLLVPQAVGEQFDRLAPGPTVPGGNDEGWAARRPFPENVELIVLSPREWTVLQLLHEHDSIADIAKALTVSVNTVKKQTVSIYAKLGVSHREAALRHAQRLGLLTSGK